MSKRTILSMLVLLLSVDAMSASLSTETRQIVGHGRTHDEAVVNGLIEAIRQVRGLEVDALSKIRWVLQDIYQENKGEVSSTNTATDDVLRRIQTRTHGFIRNYEILVSDKGADGDWKVTMQVYVYVPSRPDPEKPKLAIWPIRAQASSTTRSGLNFDEIARQITERVIAQVVQSHRFQVLDRTSPDVEKERQRILSNNMPVRELARLGEQLGADYLLLGTISEVYGTSTRNVLYNVPIVSHEIVLDLNVRIVEFAECEIRWTDNVSLKFSRSEREQESGVDRYIPELVKECCAYLNEGPLDVIMPVRVLGVLDGKIYLNQGAIRLTPGEQFIVSGLPREMTNPDTGRIIRIEGPQLATLGIQTVAESYSVADVLDGKIDTIEVGLPCKRLPANDDGQR
ncbi:MAG: penicillin-binding protein activator LpoB [Phycisphaerae bacterium]|nr:penicillin-binding protein activator LpoB [Phycisphaerae bacterium]